MVEILFKDALNIKSETMSEENNAFIFLTYFAVTG
jgi:hypothetical protein